MIMIGYFSIKTINETQSRCCTRPLAGVLCLTPAATPRSLPVSPSPRLPVPREGKPDRILAPVHTCPLSRLCPAKGELAPAQILGLGLQDAGWPMQGNGAQ